MPVTEHPRKTVRAGQRTSHRPAGGDGSAPVLQKGQQTKAAIVDAALGLATQIGLEGLSHRRAGRGHAA